MSPAPLDLVDVCSMLDMACREAGGARRWAAQNGVSDGYVSDVLNGRKAPGDAILSALGLVRVVRYARVTPRPAVSADRRNPASA